jgi:hypothetical protein
MDGDAAGPGWAGGHGRNDTMTANTRAAAAMSAATRREAFIADLPPVSGMTSSSLYTPR